MQVLALALALGISAMIFSFRDQIRALGDYGYLGVFLISIAVSATIVLPAPGWLIIATLGTILNPYLVGLVSALGGTIGELTGYLLGYGGRMAIKNAPMYQRMVGWMQRWGGLVIFVLAAIPNPLFDIAGAAAGALRMPLWKFLLYGSLGRIPKHMAYAILGSWSLGVIGCIGH
ncbi:MAG: VTT domain-containing protein [Chloroflexi bacterium]|nr:VTT domain-containing protein [Chloroflexota bacterium]